MLNSELVLSKKHEKIILIIFILIISLTTLGCILEELNTENKVDNSKNGEKEYVYNVLYYFYDK